MAHPIGVFPTNWPYGKAAHLVDQSLDLLLLLTPWLVIKPIPHGTGSLSARLSTTAGLLGSVSHAESMELALAQEAAQNWPCFGIVLAKQKLATIAECSDGLLPLVVAQIERGSPADK